MKKIIFLIFFMLFHSFAFANKLDNENVSRWMLFLGRLHPLILHLPIGALIITFYLDIIGRIQKKYPKSTIKYALGFSSFFAILTSVFGYFLSLEGGYGCSGDS
jgi:cbb3-type cytochrome oxidase subunit 1